MSDLWTAALDLGLNRHSSLVMLAQAPIRWDELLDTRLPLLISHQVGDWDEIAAALHEAGAPASLPARLVEPDGRVLALVWQGRALRPSPASDGWTLALGWTSPEEGWRSRLPLWGRRYVVTRASDKGQALVQRLEKLGARAYSVPTISFSDPDDLAPWTNALSELTTFSWLIFTSPNGVEQFLSRLRQSGLDLRALGNAKLACIGPSTAGALAAHGLKADLVPREYVAEGLLAALRAELGEAISTQRFLIPRAQIARSVLPDGLAETGAYVLVAPVYKTIPPDLAALPADEEQSPPRLLFTSSSTVENWVEAVAQHPTARAWPCLCIGPITAETARRQGLQVLGVAQEYTIDGLVETLLRIDGRENSGTGPE